MKNNGMDHLDFLNEIVNADVGEIRRKEATYRGSWKRRGGTAAFHVTARKWDRLEAILEPKHYDVFQAIQDDEDNDVSGDDGSVLAEIRDLRRYLILIEAEMISRTYHVGRKLPEIMRAGTPDDGGHHARLVPSERLDDGLALKDIDITERQYYLITAPDRYIVDRRLTPREMWEHLPVLSTEQNNTEYTELPVEYQKLYRWMESDSKWSMLPEYQEHWSKI